MSLFDWCVVAGVVSVCSTVVGLRAVLCVMARSVFVCGTWSLLAGALCKLVCVLCVRRPVVGCIALQLELSAVGWALCVPFVGLSLLWSTKRCVSCAVMECAVAFGGETKWCASGVVSGDALGVVASCNRACFGAIKDHWICEFTRISFKDASQTCIFIEKSKELEFTFWATTSGASQCQRTVPPTRHAKEHMKNTPIGRNSANTRKTKETAT